MKKLLFSNVKHYISIKPHPLLWCEEQIWIYGTWECLQLCQVYLKLAQWLWRRLQKLWKVYRWRTDDRLSWGRSTQAYTDEGILHAPKYNLYLTDGDLDSCWMSSCFNVMTSRAKLIFISLDPQAIVFTSPPPPPPLSHHGPVVLQNFF